LCGKILIDKDIRADFRIPDDCNCSHEATVKVGNKIKADTARRKFAIKKVIFNPPATIVLWKDGDKTVVHCSKDDTFNREMGLALCIAKKALGNNSRNLNDLLLLAEEEKGDK
jgi:hypothetical protein